MVLGPGAKVRAPSALVSSSRYPIARNVAVSDILHGTRVDDPYRWLEDGASPEVDRWFREEDQLARATLSALPQRVALAARLRQLEGSEARERFVHAGGGTFHQARDGAHDRARVFFVHDGEPDARVVIDPNGWGDDNLGDWTPSLEGSKVAYEVKRHNVDAASWRVLDMGAGGPASDLVEGVEGSAPQWLPGGDAFYYVYTPPEAAHAERSGHAVVRLHRLGSQQQADQTVFPATGSPTSTLECAVDPGGHWLVVTVRHGWRGADVYFRHIGGEGTWRPLVGGSEATYRVLLWKDRFVVQTDEGAPNGRVFVVDPTDAARDRWREIVPERKASPLRRAAIAGDRLLLTYSTDALTSFEAHDLEGHVRAIGPPGIGASFMTGRPGEDTAFLHYSSMGTPPEVWRVSMRTGERSLAFRQAIPVDAGRFVTEAVFARSKDGTRIPVFIVHARGIRPDGSAPALIYGYGGFRVSLQPAFVAGVVPWLERGGVYVLACLRGGLEYGEAWHRAGMRRDKQNVFDDFIASAEYLTTLGWSRAGRIVIQGNSNGGLLVAAAAEQRPELFAGVIAGEPLTDMVRYPIFGRGGVPEFGDPEDADDFRALFAYSPYHHIRDGVAYPPFLVTASAKDERADAMHARKFVARLQAASTGKPVLLRVEWAGGHLGAAGANAEIEKRSDELAFALAAVGED
jgi:prolyl oligopeptidase